MCINCDQKEAFESYFLVFFWIILASFNIL